MAGDGLRIDVKIDAERGSNEFKQARREITARRREAMAAAAQAVMPEARRRTPHFASGHLTVRATARSAFITTKGLSRRYQRALGLLEFGGTVSAKISPRQAQALRTPEGPRAGVNKARHYRGKHFLTGAIQSRRKQIDEAILVEMMKAFDGFEHTP